MSDVKTYKIRGEVRKPTIVMTFLKEVAALSREQAIEKIYSLFGSRHRLKRFQIKILEVEELTE